MQWKSSYFSQRRQGVAYIFLCSSSVSPKCFALVKFNQFAVTSGTTFGKFLSLSFEILRSFILKLNTKRIVKNMNWKNECNHYFVGQTISQP